jgi:NADH:ubiquinone oxidoreductase subunit F (NADH-binding)
MTALDGITSSPILHESVTYGPATSDPVGAVRRDDLPTHRSANGVRIPGGPDLLDAVELAGLTGYGGAHRPVGLKWRAAMAAGSGGTVVANAAEGEPVSAKDATLWLTRPHLVLDGLAQVAETVGADDTAVWIHRDAHQVIDSIRSAIAERSSLERVPRLLLAPNRYVAGQSTAVVNALRGGPAIPRFIRPGARSWDGGPSVLVHNTETLARVAQIAMNGPSTPLAALVTVATEGVRTVLEVEGDTRYSSLAPQSSPSAVLLGGYGGTWYRWNDVAELPILSDLPRLGAGVIAVLGADACGLAETARIAEWMAAESARGCGPCRFGLPELASNLTRLAGAGRFRHAADAIHQLADLVDGRGACAHPDGVVQMVRSSLITFADDVLAHQRGRCVADHSRSTFPIPGVPHGS